MTPVDARIDGRLDELGLGRVVAQALRRDATEIAITGSRSLKPNVQRVQLAVDGQPRSVIVKRLAPEIARRNRLVVERWLPAVGLAGAAPAVLGILTGPDPAFVWLVSEDLGAATFAAGTQDRGRIEAAVSRIAQIHKGFAGHALLGEVRLWGGDLGMSLHASNLRDAIRALESLREPSVEPTGARAALRDRVLARLAGLLEDAPRRAAAMAGCGGPETLLHGDLWLANLVEVEREHGPEIALIDWDHAAVGPPLYDVSTLLYRFPRRERRSIWALYVRALGAVAWRLPDESELALLCETAEHGRIANRVIWPALAVRDGEGQRAWAELEQVAGWFDDLEPLFP